ncbi:MAG: hypothetical protein FJX72_10950, partial [Armatimonadetes bacterium]|nr:hypothetical protein [Armatimonadota bacterium]
MGMTRAFRIGGGIIAALFVLWAGAGAWVWSRNSVPSPPTPSRTLPDGNVYPDYVQLVLDVKDHKGIQRLHLDRDTPAAPIARTLTQNARVLESLRSLAGKPCAVTDLQPGEKFVGAVAFPGVTRLAALSFRTESKRDSATALGNFLGGVHFSAGVMRKGATLHVTTGFLSFVPLFLDAPTGISRLNAAQCQRAAREVLNVLESQSPLSEIMANERCVRLGQIARTVQPGASSIFRLKFPTEDYERAFLAKPKRPAYDALDRYMTAWVAESRKPIGAVVPPPAAKGLEGIMPDESLEPRAMGTHLMRYTYITARLRILLAALLVEGRRKAK